MSQHRAAAGQVEERGEREDERGMLVMNSIQLRTLDDREFEQAYKIICDTVDRLLSKDIRRWTVRLARCEYERRQCKNQNYALVCDGKLVVVFSILQETHPYWDDQLGNKDHWWLSTMATASSFRCKQMR